MTRTGERYNIGRVLLCSNDITLKKKVLNTDQPLHDNV